MYINEILNNLFQLRSRGKGREVKDETENDRVC